MDTNYTIMVARWIVYIIQHYGRRYSVPNMPDRQQMIQDVQYFLIKRALLDIQKFDISIEDPTTGARLLVLSFKIQPKVSQN